MAWKQLSPKLPPAAEALPGRNEPMQLSNSHFISGNSLQGPYPDNCQKVAFGLGCFWGAERKFWELPGVYSTAVGYTAGFTPNPTYEEVCSGRTGHNEAVLVVFDPEEIPYSDLLKCFWESHDPTQGMRQGNDIGTQYRSGIYYFDNAQRDAAEESKQRYSAALQAAGFGEITSEIEPARAFYFAEDYHQQYLAKNPAGYCGIGGIGVGF